MAENKTTFVVINENTFGYTFDDITKDHFRVNIMAVDYLKGGEPLLLYNQMLVSKKASRKATTQDFHNFRVSVKGYYENEQYDFIR